MVGIVFLTLSRGSEGGMNKRAVLFSELGSVFWNHLDFVRTDHFRRRCRERGFDERWPPLLWKTGTWSDAGDNLFAIEGKIPGDGWWKLIVDPCGRQGVPAIVTVKYQGATRRAW